MFSITNNGIRISICKGGVSMSVPVGKGMRIRHNVDGSSSISFSSGGTTIRKRIRKEVKKD